MSVLKITVWIEYVHERTSPEVAQVYPDGIHQVIAEGLQQDLGDQVRVTTATLDEPDQGLSDARLSSTDVLLWWGHAAHLDVERLELRREQLFRRRRRQPAGLRRAAQESGRTRD